jgi:hypothetical protein
MLVKFPNTTLLKMSFGHHQRPTVTEDLPGKFLIDLLQRNFSIQSDHSNPFPVSMGD